MTQAKITLIAAIDENNGLGYRGNLLCHLPADLQHFKQSTSGKPVIMGSATYASIGKPLAGRKNIVFSREAKLDESVTYVRQVGEALEQCAADAEIMIIGGASIYSLFLPIADELLVTHIHGVFEADVFFPSIDADKWSVVRATQHQQDQSNSFAYTIKTYHRREG